MISHSLKCIYIRVHVSCSLTVCIGLACVYKRVHIIYNVTHRHVYDALILFFGVQEYEDLDEILARFIQPMASFARDLITHNVYRAANGGDRKTLEKLLSDERKKNPKRIPYFFSASKKTPGKFLLAYQPGTKPIIEHFSLTPDGYRYRSKVHSSVNALITWFKGHYREPIPRPTPSSQSMPPPQSHRQYHTPQYPIASPMSSTHGSRTGGNTPYTPQWPNATPPPSHYSGHHQASSYSQPTQHQYSGYSGGYQQQQQYRGGTTGAHSYGQHGGNYQGGGGYQGRGSGGGGWAPQQSWVSTQSFSRTPGQTPGQTPAYTPTQTPGSYVGSVTGTPHSRGGHPRHTPSSPLGTPILDE